MSLIEEILKYSNKHARVIILILLGVITSGSIAGGLWVQNLNSIITEKDKILEQRIQITKQEGNIGLASQNLSRRELNLQIIAILSKLELSVQTSTNELKGLAKEIEIVANSSKTISQKQQQLLSHSKTLTEQSANISKELELAMTEIQNQMGESSRHLESRAFEKTRDSGSLLLPTLLALLILLAISNLYLLRRNQKLKAKSVMR